MRTKSGRTLLVALAVGLTGCTAPRQPAPEPPTATPPVSTTTTTSESPAPQPMQAAPGIDPAAVTAAVKSVDPAATVGVEVVDLTTGTELLAIEPDRQFRSASLVKLLIAIDALAQGADARVQDRIRTMLRVSDDDIASWLWVRGDGPAIIRRTSESLGLTGTQPPQNAGQWGDVLLTPHDVARVYRFVITRLPHPERALIIDSLATAPQQAADGFDQYFGIPSALKAPWAIKQGWSNSRTDIVVHTSGLVGENWRYVVVVLTQHPRAVPWRVATKSVTAGTQALTPPL
ncbi:MAG TPA: serine hydrolase [Actinophytocola sp.]|uniref:serine hydrolase n=1 Tax=Actinophytocola sp. TaxID=1872138 RepID=UPI002DBCD007|nr:serine hydrolase [Actinophytocola sp.]HEU5471475.1 serine hydrolase [Actinophytocola sp.]